MTNAKELFEGLGFILVEDNEKELLYKYNGDAEKYWGFNLSFWKPSKEFIFAFQGEFDDDAEYINMDIFKAIQKQLDELGWL